mmetsp:Transcript_18727/g.59331  ORF Transcript_18727/g.59331 Transcript_18727/m.59331 type:complete len:200 (-) Transcript_18727:1124-1723(-)
MLLAPVHEVREQVRVQRHELWGVAHLPVLVPCPHICTVTRPEEAVRAKALGAEILLRAELRELRERVVGDHIRVRVRRTRECLVHLGNDVVDEARDAHKLERLLDLLEPSIAVGRVVATALDVLAVRPDTGAHVGPHATSEFLHACELNLQGFLPRSDAEHLLACVLKRLHLDAHHATAAVHCLHHDAEGEARLLLELG